MAPGAQLRPDGGWVSTGAMLAESVVLAPGTVVHDGARIQAGTTFGANVVVHPGTIIGTDCLIEDGAVLGKRPRLRPGSQAAGEVEPLVVGDGVTICCGAIVYAGARIGERAIIGDQAHVRERAEVGEGTVIGRGSTVDFSTRVGAGVLIQTLVYLTAHALVEDDVFIGPGVITTNDDTMGRHPPGEPLRGPVLRRGCRIGGGAVLTPGVTIGVEAFVAAGAVVTADVAARGVVMGVPGRTVRHVGDEDLLERWR
jgi:UDP-2-acetamido-3-amino-2,3-dideoxy-glucuronate N-acetyltransferase